MAFNNHTQFQNMQVSLYIYVDWESQIWFFLVCAVIDKLTLHKGPLYT